ncbi:hypothetical protein DAPPUDRAFT_256810 [Daphnia pulex]|uniref:Uncharacterized protein n=1 Tax=Daphnia pulex TaxID=6669 RepID=E9HC50_DAPPU|nr:hypothetical protein DAPPUDRAFT_256810 [Daphnia pulex]|eukprot:EFX70718.1 hypothetical protein DAPPUDRAFT_256810 [Daphnia pulex]
MREYGHKMLKANRNYVIEKAEMRTADYLSLMRSRVAEEQALGYLMRLETLTELQQRLASGFVPKRQTLTFTTPGSHRGEMSKQHNSIIGQRNCWKEAKTNNQQSEVHQQEEPKGAPKPNNKFLDCILSNGKQHFLKFANIYCFIRIVIGLNEYLFLHREARARGAFKVIHHD